MMYTLNASGQTSVASTAVLLWAAGTSGTRLRIQNLSGRPLEVHVALPPVNSITPPPIVVALPSYGDFVDETWVDSTLAVSVICQSAGAPFTAVRMA